MSDSTPTDDRDDRPGDPWVDRGEIPEDDTSDPAGSDGGDPAGTDGDAAGTDGPGEDRTDSTATRPAAGSDRGDTRSSPEDQDAGGGAPAGTPGRGVLVERAAARGVQPKPPPRRTGVFVDVDELRAHVGSQLRTMLGGYEVDALGNMTFTSDGARIFVTVGPGPMGPHVGVFSIVTVDQPLTPELASFLLTTNHRMAFGAFSYEAEQRAVWLRHSLLGATLDAPELRSTIISVATSASTVAEVLRDKFGGGSFADASAERQAAVHPPEPSHDDDGAVNVSGYL